MAAGIPWTMVEGGGPLVACAIHAGHEVRSEALRHMAIRRGQRFVVLDLHSYNHRRSGPEAPPADPAGNPEINVGTGSLDRERWGPLVDRFADDLRTVD